MKHPNEMSAAAINRELDAIDKKQSVLLDEFIAAGRGNERPTDWQDKTDPLSMKEKALSERRADLMHEVRRRAGPGMYRLPKGFGPMKNPATRKPGTVAAINRQIDAINRRGKNPARTATLVARKPAAKRSTNPPPKFGVRVNAGNDRSGNPRRGWIVCELTPEKINVLEFVDHGYTGARALRDRHGDIPTMGEFAISAAEYKDLKRSGWSDG